MSLPALIITLRDCGDAQTAKAKAETAAAEAVAAKRETNTQVRQLSYSSYIRDDQTWKFLKVVLDEQAIALTQCLDRTDRLSFAVDRLYRMKNLTPPRAATKQPRQDEPRELPENLGDVQKKSQELNK